MKKVVLSIIIFILIIFAPKVEAASFKTSLVGDSTFNDEITLYLQIDSLEDFTGSCNGLCGLTSYLKYDTEKIGLLEVKAMEDFKLIYGEDAKKIVLYQTNGKGNNTKILEIKFKNISLADNEETIIELIDQIASNGDHDIKGDNISKKIKYTVNEPEDSPSNNNQSNNSEDNNTNKEEKGETKSQNNKLSSLRISNLDIKFSKDKDTYNVTVENSTSEITIEGTPENNNAKIEGLGKHELKVGKNTIVITVTAEDGSTKAYTLNIIREDKKDSSEEIITTGPEYSDIDEDNNEKNNNYILSIIIITLLTIIVLIVIISKRKNKNKKQYDF